MGHATGAKMDSLVYSQKLCRDEHVTGAKVEPPTRQEAH